MREATSYGVQEKEENQSEGMDCTSHWLINQERKEREGVYVGTTVQV